MRDAVNLMVQFRDAKTKPEALDIRPIHAAETPADLVAVDGSYTFLYNLGSMWLAVARAAAIPYTLGEDGFHPRPPGVVGRAVVGSLWGGGGRRESEGARK